MVYIKNIPNQLIYIYIYIINKNIDSLVDFLLSFDYENIDKRKLASNTTNLNMLCEFLDTIDETNKSKLFDIISNYIWKNYHENIVFLEELGNDIIYRDLTFAYDLNFFIKHIEKRNIWNRKRD